jgi:hypothetical protein
MVTLQGSKEDAEVLEASRDQCCQCMGRDASSQEYMQGVLNSGGSPEHPTSSGLGRGEGRKFGTNRLYLRTAEQHNPKAS